MRVRTTLLIGAAASVAAAVQPAGAQRACRAAENPPPGTFLMIGTGSVELKPGESQVLPVRLSDHPQLPGRPLPRGCTARWRVDAGAPATIDRRGRLTIAPSAAVGTAFMVYARVGRDSARVSVSVVDPRPNPIAGMWHETAPARCTREGALEPVRELELRRNGGFSLTFMPFESYVDYWGHYTYDSATGALALRVEGGNSLPADPDLQGTARVVDGHLVLEGMWLGQPQSVAPRTCTYTF